MGIWVAEQDTSPNGCGPTGDRPVEQPFVRDFAPLSLTDAGKKWRLDAAGGGA